MSIGPVTGAAGGVPAPRAASEGIASVVDLLRSAGPAGGVRSVYQPLVSLEDGAPVAVEALARGHGHLAGAGPMELFPAAERAGVAAELDWECRAAAVRGALDGGLGGALPLFVNVEPRWLGSPCPERLRDVVARGHEHLRLVVEVTERSLVTDPAALLRAVRTLRAAGCGIALDDVGADPASLALLPLVEPDVVKLDLRLVQERTDRELATVASAVLAYAERSGAAVVAEGLESDEHVERALVLGATLGQGWRFGRPGPLADVVGTPPASRLALPFAGSTAPADAGTPFEIVERAAAAGRLRTPVRTASKSVLLPMSHLLEQQAMHDASRPVLLAAFEDARHFTARTVRRYAALAPRCAFAAALGAGMPATPVAGVRGAGLHHDDPLRGEWVVVVLGPHYAGALVAKDLGDPDDGPDGDFGRRFAFVLTHDRALVAAAARSLMGRVAPLATGAATGAADAVSAP